jgi:hypothetical protein
MRPKISQAGRGNLVPAVLIAAAILLGALATIKVASFLRVQNLSAQIRHLGEQDPKHLQDSLKQAKETVDGLKKSNLFVRQPPKEHPVKQVDGILGSEVLIGGKWYKVGEQIGDAKIVAITSTEVKIAWDGREQTFAPLAAVGAEAPPPPQAPGKPQPEKPPETAKAAPPSAPAEVKVAAAPADNDPLAWMGVTLPPQIKAKLLEQWNQMPEEEKEKAKDKWNSMPQADKDKAVEELSRMP